jgi:propanol-preferring alcohol dehydrogenase
VKAIRLTIPNCIDRAPLQQVEVCPPQPVAGQVRLRLSVCGACHTDLHIAEGDIHPPCLPVTPGHQAVGVIEAIGAGTNTPLKMGDRVGVPWLHHACGVCDFCRRGEQNLCPNAQFTGFDVDGGFAEAMLAQVDFVLSLPPALSNEQAAPLLCAGIIGYRSLRQAGVLPGEHVGLFGFGASAHLAIQVARHWGCTVSVFTRAAHHRRHAEDLGAAWTGSAEQQPPVPLDRAILFAPVGDLVPLALQRLRPGGTLAINAIHLSDIPTLPYALLFGERTLRSVSHATYQDGVEFLKLVDEINFQIEFTPYPLADANRALQDVKHSRLNGEAVLIIG